MRAVMGRLGRSAAFVSALVLAAASAAACSSGGSSSGGGGGGSGSFKDVLKDIHDTAGTADFIEYADTAQVAKLNGVTSQTSSGPFARLLGLGAGQLPEYGPLLPPLTGFDANSATSAISLGNPPNQVGVLYGSFDPAAIGAKLAAWGYTKQDRGGGITAWVFKDNHQTDLTKLDANGVGPGMTGWLDVIWVSKSSIAYGGATSDLAAALPAQSEPLSGGVVGSLADCLGSVLAVDVITDQKEIQNSAVSAIALGVTGTSAADAREEICAAAPTDAGARGFAAGFTKEVGSGKDFVSNQPWSNLLSDPVTNVLGGSAHIVRLSAKPAGGAMALVFTLVRQEDFATLLGLPQRLPGGRTVSPSGQISVPSASGTATDSPSDTSTDSPSDTSTDSASDTSSPTSS